MKKLLLFLLLTISVRIYSQGDCPPTPVCANTAGTCLVGSILELNATNQGCLFGEAPRTSWLSICFSSNGIFKFAITPGGGVNNDMDFAVWGPNSPCPPIAAPIRCSYAAVPPGGPKVTGLSSANNFPQTDLSEGGAGNQWVQDLNVLSGQCYVICISNYAGGNNNWSLNFAGTTAGMVCSALPIELILWDGNYRNSANVLEWVTATEINCNFYDIERSTDGSFWSKIARVNGHGTSTNSNFYTYHDNLFTENSYNYYRLVQYDFDGQYETFNIIAIDNTKNSSTKKVLGYYDVLGREIHEEYFEGVYIIKYEDGTFERKCCTIPKN